MRAIQYLEPNTSSEVYKDYEITFDQALRHAITDDKIFVLATIELQNTKTPDRFCVNIANISSSGFTARVTRLDGEGWGMHLQLNYMVSPLTVGSQI